MFKHLGRAAVGLSMATALSGAITAEVLAQEEVEPVGEARVTFFCNGGADENAIPVTAMSISQGDETFTETILIWTPVYFSERAMALDLCQESARNLQAIEARADIAMQNFRADRVGEAIRICLQPEEVQSDCQSESVVVATYLPQVDPRVVLSEVIPDSRTPRLRGDFPTVYPAFPFGFFRFRF